MSRMKFSSSPYSPDWIILVTELDDGTPTPTLRQMFQALRQLQFDMQEIKSQLNQERTLRTDLQRMLFGHIDGCGTN